MKKSIVLVVAIALVMAFTGIAMAAKSDRSHVVL